MKKWKQEEDNIIKKQYKTFNKELLLRLLSDRSWGAINTRARRLQIKRELGAAYSNITYFDNWSNEMAYVLGFIASDGSIIDRTKSTGDMVLSIGLAEKDKEHLEKIRDMLAPNKKIWEYIKNKKFKSVCLRIGSRYMCDRLLKLGICNRKSLILEFPKIPKEHIRHFIRGYFDGDGSFGVYKKYNEARVSFCSGSKGILNSINFYINEELKIGIKNIIYGEKAHAYYLNYFCNQSLRVCDWMYKDSDIYLDRKYEKYQKLLREKSK